MAKHKSLNNNLDVYKNKRQKQFQDWVKANEAATLNENQFNHTLPRRGQLIDLFEKILDEAYVHAPVMHRQEKFIDEKFIMINDSEVVNKEATKLLDHHWFRKFLTETYRARLFGYSLPELIFNEEGYVENIKSIQRRNIVPEKRIVFKNPNIETSAIEWEKSEYDPYLIWIEDDFNDSFGILNKVIIPTLSVMYCHMYWFEHADKAGLPMILAKTNINAQEKYDNLQSQIHQLGRDGFILGDIEDDINLLNRNQTGHQIYLELIQERKTEIMQAILGQVGTTSGSSNYRDSFNNMAIENMITESDGSFKEHVVNDLLLPKLSKFPKYSGLKGLKFKRFKQTTLDFEQSLKVYTQAIHDPNIKISVESLNRIFPNFDFEEVQPLNLPQTPKNNSTEEDED